MTEGSAMTFIGMDVSLRRWGDPTTLRVCYEAGRFRVRPVRQRIIHDELTRSARRPAIGLALPYQTRGVA
jgi:hypothetical protein